MKKTLLIVAALLAVIAGGIWLKGCKPDAIQTYDLEISFFGLIAFVEDGDRVWALSVDADYDPTLPQVPGNFPPCVLDEASPDDAKTLEQRFPPHYSFLKLHGTNLAGLEQPSGLIRIPLAATDIRLETNAKTELSLHLEKEGDRPGILTHGLASMILGEREREDEEIPDIPTGRDTVDSSLLEADVSKAFGQDSLEGRLSTRVVIDRGKLISQADRQKDEPAFFGLQLPRLNPFPCRGRRRLAEEVKWLIEGLTSPAELILTPFDGSGSTRLRITPSANPLAAEKRPTVEVQVVNQVAWAIATDVQRHSEPLHFEAFRWYYRLAREEEGCPNDYFVCDRFGTPFNGRKCPVKQLLR